MVEASEPKPKRRSRKRRIATTILLALVASLFVLPYFPEGREALEFVVFDIVGAVDPTGFFERLRLRDSSLVYFLEDITHSGMILRREGERLLRLDFLNVAYEPNMNITRIYVETERDPIEIRATSKHAAIFVVEGKEYYQPGGIGRAEVYDGRFYMERGETLTLHLELPPGEHEGLWKIGEEYHVIVLHDYGVSVYTLVCEVYPRVEFFARRR